MKLDVLDSAADMPTVGVTDLSPGEVFRFGGGDPSEPLYMALDNGDCVLLAAGETFQPERSAQVTKVKASLVVER